MIKKREREISLDDIDDTDWDEYEEDETYVDPTTTSLTQEEDDKPVSTIRILVFIIHLGLFKFAAMTLNGLIRSLAFLHGLYIKTMKRL
ncbi:hypothetical protein K0K20_004399 [Salmonella enterica]|nr:hypothetical protein [Salmonella enterica subsp. enterica serovar Schwarzengrund]EHV3418908.1 hypothetical protein [Salmonella enterica]EIJ5929793.1 hypothetical protein [Salmonella enterica subsp. enterica serovar Infantis]